MESRARDEAAQIHRSRGKPFVGFAQLALENSRASVPAFLFVYATIRWPRLVAERFAPLLIIGVVLMFGNFASIAPWTILQQIPPLTMLHAAHRFGLHYIYTHIYIYIYVYTKSCYRCTNMLHIYIFICIYIYAFAYIYIYNAYRCTHIQRCVLLLACFLA